LLNIGLGRDDNPKGSAKEIASYEYHTGVLTYAGGCTLALGVL